MVPSVSYAGPIFYGATGGDRRGQARRGETQDFDSSTPNRDKRDLSSISLEFMGTLHYVTWVFCYGLKYCTRLPKTPTTRESQKERNRLDNRKTPHPITVYLKMTVEFMFYLKKNPSMFCGYRARKSITIVGNLPDQETATPKPKVSGKYRFPNGDCLPGPRPR